MEINDAQFEEARARYLRNRPAEVEALKGELEHMQQTIRDVQQELQRHPDIGSIYGVVSVELSTDGTPVQVFIDEEKRAKLSASQLRDAFAVGFASTSFRADPSLVAEAVHSRTTPAEPAVERFTTADRNLALLTKLGRPVAIEASDSWLMYESSSALAAKVTTLLTQVHASMLLGDN